MIRRLLAVLALLLTPLVAAPAFAQQKAQAVFAGGCFWCMEHDMKAIPGVLEVMSGYTGGKEKHPTYEQVSSETTGHYESVRVTYDPSKVTYEQILSRYWKLIDPTDNGGQFCDRGPSYRPAIFVTPEQRPIAEASKQKLIDSKKLTKPVIVPILPLGEFWPAEEYHRDFSEKNAAHYNAYRKGCGRDVVLKQIWKNAG
jgi:peptide-methionine (S)-S-oxide reductase